MTNTTTPQITITITQDVTPAQLADAIRDLGADDMLSTYVDPFWSDEARRVLPLTLFPSTLVAQTIGTLTITAAGAVSCHCGQSFFNKQGLYDHQRSHVVTGGPVKA
jgi:hypothetical protein